MSILAEVWNKLVWAPKWGFYGHVKLPRERMKLARHFEPLYDLLAGLELELCTSYAQKSSYLKGFWHVFRDRAGASSARLSG